MAVIVAQESVGYVCEEPIPAPMTVVSDQGKMTCTHRARGDQGVTGDLASAATSRIIDLDFSRSLILSKINLWVVVSN